MYPSGVFLSSPRNEAMGTQEQSAKQKGKRKMHDEGNDDIPTSLLHSSETSPNYPCPQQSHPTVWDNLNWNPTPDYPNDRLLANVQEMPQEQQSNQQRHMDHLYAPEVQIPAQALHVPMISMSERSVEDLFIMERDGEIVGIAQALAPASKKKTKRPKPRTIDMEGVIAWRDQARTGANTNSGSTDNNANSYGDNDMVVDPNSTSPPSRSPSPSLSSASPTPDHTSSNSYFADSSSFEESARVKGPGGGSGSGSGAGSGAGAGAGSGRGLAEGPGEGEGGGFGDGHGDEKKGTRTSAGAVQGEGSGVERDCEGTGVQSGAEEGNVDNRDTLDGTRTGSGVELFMEAGHNQSNLEDAFESQLHQECGREREERLTTASVDVGGDIRGRVASLSASFSSAYGSASASGLSTATPPAMAVAAATTTSRSMGEVTRGYDLERESRRSQEELGSSYARAQIQMQTQTQTQTQSPTYQLPQAQAPPQTQSQTQTQPQVQPQSQPRLLFRRRPSFKSIVLNFTRSYGPFRAQQAAGATSAASTTSQSQPSISGTTSFAAAVGPVGPLSPGLGPSTLRQSFAAKANANANGGQSTPPLSPSAYSHSRSSSSSQSTPSSTSTSHSTNSSYPFASHTHSLPQRGGPHSSPSSPSSISNSQSQSLVVPRPLHSPGALQSTPMDANMRYEYPFPDPLIGKGGVPPTPGLTPTSEVEEQGMGMGMGKQETEEDVKRDRLEEMVEDGADGKGEEEVPLTPSPGGEPSVAAVGSGSTVASADSRKKLKQRPRPVAISSISLPAVHPLMTADASLTANRASLIARRDDNGEIENGLDGDDDDDADAQSQGSSLGFHDTRHSPRVEVKRFSFGVAGAGAGADVDEAMPSLTRALSGLASLKPDPLGINTNASLRFGAGGLAIPSSGRGSRGASKSPTRPRSAMSLGSGSWSPASATSLSTCPSAASLIVPTKPRSGTPSPTALPTLTHPKLSRFNMADAPVPPGLKNLGVGGGGGNSNTNLAIPAYAHTSSNKRGLKRPAPSSSPSPTISMLGQLSATNKGAKVLVGRGVSE